MAFSTTPILTISPQPATVDQCGGGPIIIDFANNGALAKNVVISYTLPAGLAYNGLAAGTNPTPMFSPTIGATGQITFLYSVIGTQVTTNTLRFNVKNNPAVCATPGALADNPADMRYQDSCGTNFDDVTAANNTITVQRSVIVASQTPITQVIQFGGIYTWTIRITNTGNSPTNNLLVTETLGSGWQVITASAGSPGGAAPVIAGNVITWPVGSLSNSGSNVWTATVRAQALDAGTGYRATLNASTACSDGGCFTTTQVINYATPLQSFGKTTSPTPVSIGEPVTYTLRADFFGTRPYTSTLLTDTLPTLSGQLVFSVTNVQISNENPISNTWVRGPIGGSVLTFTTASVPSGTVLGPDQIFITVTGFISNTAVATNNKVFTNTLSMTYRRGRPALRVQQRCVTGTIREPFLVMTKSATPNSNIKAGDEITYTLRITHTPQSTATAYDLVFQDVIPSPFTYKAGSLQAPGAAATFTSDQLITATYARLPLGSGLVITYVVTVDPIAQPSSLLTNTAVVSHTSLPGASPNERTGSGVGPNNYYTNTQAVVSTADLSVGKVVLDPRKYTIGEAITYSVFITVPSGLTRNLVFTDSIPAGLRLHLAHQLPDADRAFCLARLYPHQNPASGGTG